MTSSARGAVLVYLVSARDPARVWKAQTVERGRAVVDALMPVTLLQQNLRAAWPTEPDRTDGSVRSAGLTATLLLDAPVRAGRRRLVAGGHTAVVDGLTAVAGKPQVVQIADVAPGVWSPLDKPMVDQAPHGGRDVALFSAWALELDGRWMDPSGSGDPSKDGPLNGVVRRGT